MIPAALLVLAAYAWPVADPSLAEWYRDQKVPGTALSCCDTSDGHPVDAYQDKTGQWFAPVDGKVIPIPPQRILDGFSHDPEGRAVIWNIGPLLYCFARPGQVY